MSMSVGRDVDDEDEVVSSINTTPLVDVMLVLLIIFLITIPVVTTSIKVNLPHEQNQIRVTKPENVIISVDSVGRIYIYDTPVKEDARPDRPAQGVREEEAAARGADPRRRRGAIRIGRPRDLRGPARRDHQGRFHYRSHRQPLRSIHVNERRDDRSRRRGPDVMIDINTTPLIDVMLVLLIMLIITIPIQLHAVNMDMPIGNPPPPLVKPEVVRIDIDPQSMVYWNGIVVTQGGELESKMQAAARMQTQPEVHLRPNKLAKYEVVAKVMASAQRIGLTKIGIIGSEQFLDER